MSCISLRLGLNIVERQLSDGKFYPEANPIIYKIDQEFVIAKKTSTTYGSYWSYSLSVDGHIFRKKDIQKMVAELMHIKSIYEWKNTPNEFEAALQRFWTITPQCIVTPTKSVVINSPNNKIQETHNNRFGDDHFVNKDSLLEIFKSGKRLDMNKLNIENIKCPHTEINILEGLV